MPAVPVVVVGAGPAGLAVSHELGARGVDHVVLDRGRTARELAVAPLGQPAAAQPRLGDPAARPAAGRRPGRLPHGGGPRRPPRPLRRWRPRPPSSSTPRCSPCAPAVTATASSAPPAPGAHAPSWSPPGTPPCPPCPPLAAQLPRDVHQLTADAYRRPAQLPDGGVLVVGASASGVQLADELATAGRDVVLAVGRHTRMVRSHRGVDVYRWLERLGSLDRQVDRLPDPAAALREPSLQLAGHPPEPRTPATSASPPSRPAASGSRGG